MLVTLRLPCSSSTVGGGPTVNNPSLCKTGADSRRGPDGKQPFPVQDGGRDRGISAASAQAGAGHPGPHNGTEAGRAVAHNK